VEAKLGGAAQEAVLNAVMCNLCRGLDAGLFTDIMFMHSNSVGG
jgi:hypothetical protein